LDFPVTAGAFEGVNLAAATNAVSTAFVCKLNASGTALIYSTFLGGVATPNTLHMQGDYGHVVAVDSSGNAFVTGWTYSNDFPLNVRRVSSNQRPV
jgi:Beta-propeller repeat